MDQKQTFDFVVIGGGPGGYVAAIRAAQKGLKTALIEENEMGGTCLNRGCIPSKALIANADVLRKIRSASRFGISVDNINFDYSKMRERKDLVVTNIRKSLEKLIASNKITVFQGHGRFLSPYEIAVSGKDTGFVIGEKIIIATGSEPRSLSSIPFDYKKIHDSTSLLNLNTLPKSIAIIGGGVIGCEFASMYQAFDVQVTIVELLPSILPLEGKLISDTLALSFKKRGIKIETNTLIKSFQHSESALAFHFEDGRTLEAEIALVAVGRKYNTDQIGIEKTGVIIEKDGSIPTNEYMQTNIPHIFAIGDITGKWNLAHVASHQGIIAVDHSLGKGARMNYNAIPSVIFTEPEIATIGYTVEKATEAGFDATVGKFPFQALGKSQATIETEGFAQIVISKKTGQILGAQVVGKNAATLISEMAVAIANELTAESITETIHAHPTVAESWMEAAFSAIGSPLHMPPLHPKTS